MFTDAHIWTVLLIFVFFTQVVSCQAEKERKKEMKIKVKTCWIEVTEFEWPTAIAFDFPYTFMHAEYLYNCLFSQYWKIPFSPHMAATIGIAV